MERTRAKKAQPPPPPIPAMTLSELDAYIAWLGAGPDFGHFRNDTAFIRELLDEGRKP